MVEQNNAPSLDQLKTMLKDELNGDNRDEVILPLLKQINKHSAGIVKAAADAQKKEAEALAGVREKLAIKIHKAVANQFKDELATVKAKGYTYKLDDGDITFKSVSLLVPTVRKSGGGGGGSTGVTIQSQTGMRRGELIDKFATDEEKAKIEDAKNSAKSSPGSAKWAAEKPVVKRILADNPELIKH